MFLERVSSRMVLAGLLAVSVTSVSDAAVDSAACAANNSTCLESCKRFDVGDARLPACNAVCRKNADRCGLINPVSVPPSAKPDANADRSASEHDEASDTSVLQREEADTVVSDVASNSESPSSLAMSAVLGRAPGVAPLLREAEMSREHKKNDAMLVAIHAGNLKKIRRLIEEEGLDPTYVYAYEYNRQTRQYDGRAVRLRLVDLFSDDNTLRNDAAGQDRMLALLMELGLNVKATLPATLLAGSAQSDGSSQDVRTAWGPSLQKMESAKDRAARLRAFELALQAGLVPNDDFSQWLFAELPQICGRDRSEFSIRIVDLLATYLGPALQESLWRTGERGPETVSDVLDRSFAPARAQYAHQKEEFQEQDRRWENCAPLSRRINRFLMSGK